MRSGQVTDRRCAEIVIAHLDRGIGLLQLFDDRRAELAAHRIRTQNAGIDVQEFHGLCPRQKIVSVGRCEYSVAENVDLIRRPEYQACFERAFRRHRKVDSWATTATFGKSNNWPAAPTPL